jgi:hypothetical protein
MLLTTMYASLVLGAGEVDTKLRHTLARAEERTLSRKSEFSIQPVKERGHKRGVLRRRLRTYNAGIYTGILRFCIPKLRDTVCPCPEHSARKNRL